MLKKLFWKQSLKVQVALFSNHPYPVTMPETPKLSELKELIDKCVMCGGCHAGCPTYELTRRENDAARGKVLLASAILNGELKPDGRLAEKFDHCLTCMKCVETCPAGANPVKVINSARNEIYKNSKRQLPNFIFEKLLPNPKRLSILAKFLAFALKLYSLMPPLNFLPFVKENRKRKFPNFKFSKLKSSYPKVIKGDGKASLKIGYFVGCMADSVFHDTGKAVIEIMKSAGAEVHLLKEEVCCGAPAYFAGDHESAKVMARKNVKLFNEKNFDFIVTSCATCGSVLKETYPELLGEAEASSFSSKVVDFQKLFVDELWNKLTFTENAKPIKVTYHDPCHLSRSMKVRNEPREILQKLPGVEFVEMEEADSCCGGAGSFGIKYYDDSLEIGRQKAESIRKSGAGVALTACPSCRMQIAELLNRYAPGIKITHTAILIRDMLKK